MPPPFAGGTHYDGKTRRDGSGGESTTTITTATITSSTTVQTISSASDSSDSPVASTTEGSSSSLISTIPSTASVSPTFTMPSSVTPGPTTNVSIDPSGSTTPNVMPISSSLSSEPSTATSSSAFVNSTAKDRPLGTIIGASVGGGAFLLILAAILALYLRRRSRRQRVAPSSEFLHPVAQEQFRYARSAHTMSMDSGLLSSSMEKFPASPPLPSLSPHMESFFGQATAASPSASRQSTLSTGSPQPAMYSHRARASSAGSVALSSLYVLADNGLRGGGSPLMQGYDFESPQQTYTRTTHGPEVISPFIVPEEPHDIGVAR